MSLLDIGQPAWQKSPFFVMGWGEVRGRDVERILTLIKEHNRLADGCQPGMSACLFLSAIVNERCWQALFVSSVLSLNWDKLFRRL